MSIESAKQFFDRLITDEVFAKAFYECRDPYARRAFEEKEGYTFSIDEAKNVSGKKFGDFGNWTKDGEGLRSIRRSRKYL